DHAVSVTVTDSAGSTVTQHFTINVAAPADDPPPVITSPDATTVTAGSTLSWPAVATDPAGHPLQYARGNPAPGGATSPPGVITWPVPATALGVLSQTVRVFDNLGAETRQTIQITVTAPGYATGTVQGSQGSVSNTAADVTITAPDPQAVDGSPTDTGLFRV